MAGLRTPVPPSVAAAAIIDPSARMWPLPLPEFRSKPRPQLPNRHRLAVDADPISGIRFGALLELADENDMTSKPQFIKPCPDFRAGDSQRKFVLARHGITFTINGFNLR